MEGTDDPNESEIFQVLFAELVTQFDEFGFSVFMVGSMVGI